MQFICSELAEPMGWHSCSFYPKFKHTVYDTELVHADQFDSSQRQGFFCFTPHPDADSVALSAWYIMGTWGSFPNGKASKACKAGKACWPRAIIAVDHNTVPPWIITFVCSVSEFLSQLFNTITTYKAMVVHDLKELLSTCRSGPKIWSRGPFQ